MRIGRLTSQGVLFMAGLVAIGGVLLLRGSFAADPGRLSLEPEDAQNLSGGATTVADPLASSGSYLTFTEARFDPSTLNSANSGVEAGVTLTNSGDVTISSSGTTLENKNINGCLRINASNVTVRNTKIANCGGIAAVDIDSGLTGVVLEHIDVLAAGQSRYSVNIYSESGYTLRNSELSESVDGLMMNGGGGHVIERNYFHDIHIVGDSHSDLIQATRGNNITIKENKLIYKRQATSAIIIKADLGPLDTVLIANNYSSGGSWNMYCSNGNFGKITNCVVRDNIIVKDSYLFAAIMVSQDPTNIVECNFFDDGSLANTYHIDTQASQAFPNQCNR